MTIDPSFNPSPQGFYVPIRKRWCQLCAKLTVYEYTTRHSYISIISNSYQDFSQRSLCRQKKKHGYKRNWSCGKNWQAWVWEFSCTFVFLRAMGIWAKEVVWVLFTVEVNLSPLHCVFRLICKSRSCFRCQIYWFSCSKFFRCMHRDLIMLLAGHHKIWWGWDDIFCKTLITSVISACHFSNMW